MDLIAQMDLNPGGILAWIVVGLLAGWIGSLIMGGGGYGIIGDIVVGLIGALIGGFLTGFFIEGDVGSWGSILVAILGAIVLIALYRAITHGRVTRP